MKKEESISKPSLTNRILELSNKKFTFLLLAFLILKNGIHPIGTEWINWVYSAGKSFPSPENYFSYSIIPLMIAKILNYPPYLIWWMIFLTLTLIFYFLLIINIKKIAGAEFKKSLLIFFSFPFLTTPLYYLGHYDLITISGALITGFAKSKKMVVLGALVATGSNPEQAIMTSICVVIFSLGTKSSFHQFIAKIWLSLSLSGYLLLKLFIGTSNDGNRINIIVGQLKDVIPDSIGRLNLIAFSVFGLGWVFIYLAHKFVHIFPNRLLVILGSAVLPFCLSILILDRTRVGVAVGALPLVLFIKYILDFEPAKNALINKINFEYLIIAFILVPTILIDTDGSVRLPYLELIHKFLV